jgi:uncharacterized protein (TIGR02594 family)
MILTYNGYAMVQSTGHSFECEEIRLPTHFIHSSHTFDLYKLSDSLYRLEPKAKTSPILEHLYIFNKYEYQGMRGISGSQKLFQKLNTSKKITLKFDMNYPWVGTAISQLGIKEFPGIKANPEVMKYHKAAKYGTNNDSADGDAWCGSFIAWVMSENGFTPPKIAVRASEWKKFGKMINKPIFGAIGFKFRSGGGHVGFVIGQSYDGNDLYILGGNQGNQVRISKYPKNIWAAFIIPEKVNTTLSTLPFYSGHSSKRGSEA